MTKTELLKAIEGVPDNMELFVKRGNSDFGYNPIESAYVTKVKFTEQPDSDSGPKGYETVFVLDENF